MRTARREQAAAVLILAALSSAAATGDSFWTYNLTVVGLYAMAAIGLNIVLGLAGQVTFAQSAFMAVGGYSTALLTTRAHVNGWLALIAAALGSGVLAYLIGLPLLRLRGHYLSMATFALALGTASLANGAVWLTGGATGISAIPPLSVLGYELVDSVPLLGLTWLACGLCLAVFAFLRDSHVGRAWRAVAARDDIAATLAIDIRRDKLRAFAIGAVMASVAGSLYVGFTTYVGPDFFGLDLIINLFLIVFIGGRSSLLGPVLGAGFVVLTPYLAADLGDWQTVLFFGTLLLFIVLLPGGILGTATGRLTESRGSLRTRRRTGSGSARSVGEQSLAEPSRTQPSRRPDQGVAAVLSADRLTKRFGGVTALDDVCLRLAPGTVHGVIGPNGAGKSTLVAVLSGFLRPDAGSVTLAGADVTRLGAGRRAERGLARTFQAAAPLTTLTVLENLQVGLHARYRAGLAAVLLRTPGMRREAREIEVQARASLAEYGLADEAGRPASALPFGQLRLLEVARATARGPHVLLLDEPAAGLNAIETRLLGALIAGMRKRGMAVLLVDHDVPFLFGLCDEVTVMNFGKVIASGPAAEIRHDPAVREAYLGTAAIGEVRPA